MKTDFDPMVDLDVRISGIKMKSLTPEFLLHLVAVWQLNIELHLCGTDTPRVVIKVSEKVGLIPRNIFVSSGSLLAVVIGHAATSQYPH